MENGALVCNVVFMEGKECMEFWVPLGWTNVVEENGDLNTIFMES